MKRTARWGILLWKIPIVVSSTDFNKYFHISLHIDCSKINYNGALPGHYKKKVVGLERGPLSLVSTTEELLDRKVAAPV
jgi:hypothetical protein